MATYIALVASPVLKKHYALYFTLKYNKLPSFYHRLIEFRNLIPPTEKTKMKKTTEYLKMLQIYIIQGWRLQMKKKNMDKKYNHSNLFLKNYKYDE